MAVAFDAATESVRTATTDPYSFTHTPVGTPRGVAVFVLYGTEFPDLISSITYGGVAVPFVAQAIDTLTEHGRCNLYFLGSSVPTGAQTVSVDLTSASTTDIQFVVMTFTGDVDLAAVHSNSISDNTASPQLTMAADGLPSIRIAGLYSGLPGVGSLAALSGSEIVHSHDFGNFISVVSRQSAVSSSDFTIGFDTFTVSDDVAFVAATIRELQNATVNLDTANIVPSATAAPATPDGVDIVLGATTSAATAAVSTPIVAISMTAPVATATADAIVPVGIDSGNNATVSAPIAPANAAPASPDGIDVTIGVEAAEADAGINWVDGEILIEAPASDSVDAPPAWAFAVAQEDDPMVWGEEYYPPVVQLGPQAPVASATASSSVPSSSHTTAAPPATATASVSNPIVQSPASYQARATASVVAPEIRITLAAPIAAATASSVAPTLSVAPAAPVALATASANTPGLVIALQVPAAIAFTDAPDPEPRVVAPGPLTITLNVIASAIASVDFTGEVSTGLSTDFEGPETTVTWADLLRESKDPGDDPDAQVATNRWLTRT